MSRRLSRSVLRHRMLLRRDVMMESSVSSTHEAEDSLVQCIESEDFAPSKLGTKE